MNIPQEKLDQIPLYTCHKEVRAIRIKYLKLNNDKKTVTVEPMEEGVPSIDMELDWLVKFKPMVGGYLVIYKDGYCSYSPASAFIEGYTLKT